MDPPGLYFTILDNNFFPTFLKSRQNLICNSSQFLEKIALKKGQFLDLNLQFSKNCVNDAKCRIEDEVNKKKNTLRKSPSYFDGELKSQKLI